MTTTAARQARVDFDTVVAATHGEAVAVAGRIASALDALHYAAGDKKVYLSRNVTRWSLTDADAETRVLDALTAGTIASYDVERVQRTVDALAARRAQQVELRAQLAVMDEVYWSAPWSRFFLVTSSDGHIHSSMNCSTCRWTTQFGWHPNLSGLTEADAVAELGPTLCSVCFPSAPVEWTRTAAEVKAAASADQYCTGTGYREGSLNTRYRSWSAVCTECGEHVYVTSTGKVRKHKKA